MKPLSVQDSSVEWICTDCLHRHNSRVRECWDEIRQRGKKSAHVDPRGGEEEEDRLVAIESAAAASQDHPLLHRRVFVWWSDDRVAYGGELNAYDPFSRRHRVLYDDGEWEFIDLCDEPVLFLRKELSTLPQEPSSPDQESFLRSQLPQSSKKGVKRR